MSSPSTMPIQWPQAGTTSQAVSLAGQQVVGFYTTSALQSTSLTFATCPTIDGFNVPGIQSTSNINNNGTAFPYQTVKTATAGSALSFTVAASGYYAFTGDIISQFRGIQNIKVIGGSSENVGTPVILVVREVA